VLGVGNEIALVFVFNFDVIEEDAPADPWFCASRHRRDVSQTKCIPGILDINRCPEQGRLRRTVLPVPRAVHEQVWRDAHTKAHLQSRAGLEIDSVEAIDGNVDTQPDLGRPTRLRRRGTRDEQKGQH
jgi:hypothetical protein